MSMFEDTNYRWRETYFVLFQAQNRPKLEAVREALAELSERFDLINPCADEQENFESVTLLSPDDFSALDICYTTGEEVREHVHSLLGELETVSREADKKADLQRAKHCDARFDVLHFEQLADEADVEDELEEMLDPSALLLVLGVLARLTDGLAIDPQAGTILEDGQ